MIWEGGNKHMEPDKFQTNLHVSQTYVKGKAKANRKTMIQTVRLNCLQTNVQWWIITDSVCSRK